MLYVKFAFVAIILAAAVVAFLAYRQPDEFRVERSAVINAPVEAVFAQVADLEKGMAWSPWVEMDPGASYTFSDATSGPGAHITWDGKKNGKGMITIQEVVSNQLVRSRIEFIRPFAGVNTTEFALEDQGGHTKLTWRMYGPNTLFGRVFGVFVDCDKIIGGAFEKGLSNLKTLLEAPATAQ